MPMRLTGKDEAIRLVTDDIETAFNRFLLAFYAAIQSGTPVDTGYHRLNWLVEYGGFVARVVGTRPARGSAEIPAPAYPAGVWKVTSGSVFFHNSAPVIKLLEEGIQPTARQSPQGILGPALAAIRGLLAA